MLSELKLVASTSEGKRMVKQGAVKFDSIKVTDENFQPEKSLIVVQCGKRKFAKVTLSKD